MPTGEWKLYDDSHYRVIEGGWREIVESMIDSQIRPVMVFYQQQANEITINDKELIENSAVYELLTKYYPQNNIVEESDHEMKDVTY